MSDSIEAYAERGAPRGADQVFAAAIDHSSLPAYPTSPEPGRQRSSTWVALAGIACAALLLGVWTTATDRSQPIEVNPAAIDRNGTYPDNWTDEMIAGAQELEATIDAGGWIEWSGDAAAGYSVPETAWVKVGPTVDAFDQDPCACRVAIYDRPDGTVIGYHWFDLGFAPVGADPTQSAG